MMCGGPSAAKDADKEIQDICDAVKAELESKCGKQLSEFTALQYTSQVVAGTNYFVKAHIGNNEYVHVRIFKPLPHVQEGLQVAAYQLGKSKEDEIVYFS